MDEILVNSYRFGWNLLVEVYSAYPKEKRFAASETIRSQLSGRLLDGFIDARNVTIARMEITERMP
jgi:hypothetical protein